MRPPVRITDIWQLLAVYGCDSYFIHSYKPIRHRTTFPRIVLADTYRCKIVLWVSQNLFSKT